MFGIIFSGIVVGILPASIMTLFAYSICDALTDSQKPILSNFVGILVGLCIMSFCMAKTVTEKETQVIEWNEGICPNCEIKYIPNGHNYFICPECFKEVERR